MSVDVELDVFSGRPNPRWSLGSQEETELFERMSSLPAGGGSFDDLPSLGYRGLRLHIITGNREHTVRVGHGLVQIDDDLKADPSSGLERWLLETARSVDTKLLAAIKKELH